MSKSSSSPFAGVDGCPGGWALCRVAVPGAPPALSVVQDVETLLRAVRGCRFVAVDMPIGLFETPVPGGRACCREARALLGRGRASSVFSPPARSLFHYTSYAALRREVPGHGLSIQAFNLLPKIRALDAVMTPARQRRIFEAHPELAWMALAGSPMHHWKLTPAGRAERETLLARVWPEVFEAVRSAEIPRRLAKPDDLLDACAMALVAQRRLKGEAVCLPAKPPGDSRGLRMEIWY